MTFDLQLSSIEQAHATLSTDLVDVVEILKLAKEKEGVPELIAKIKEALHSDEPVPSIGVGSDPNKGVAAPNAGISCPLLWA